MFELVEVDAEHFSVVAYQEDQDPVVLDGGAFVEVLSLIFAQFDAGTGVDQRQNAARVVSLAVMEGAVEVDVCADSVFIRLVRHLHCSPQERDYVFAVLHDHQEQPISCCVALRHLTRWLFRGSRGPPLSSVSSLNLSRRGGAIDDLGLNWSLCQ